MKKYICEYIGKVWVYPYEPIELEEFEDLR